MGTVLSEAKVGEAIDAAAADISLPDAMAAPVWTGPGWQRCDVKMHAAGLKDFAKKRNAYVPTALKP